MVKRKKKGEPIDVPKTLAAVAVLEVPLADHGRVLVSRIDLRITPRQSAALRRLYDGLVAAGEDVRLPDPQPVQSQTDALRWLLDLIADASD